MALASGTHLGAYEILEPLGAGGMGEVYRARDPRLDRDVAIKVLPASLAESPASLARFEREARVVAGLSHPNIVALFDFGSTDGVHYAVTELLDGETLRVRLASGPVPVRRAADYVAQVARGLAVAHDAGIVHRDIKPENLFLVKGGLVKILDFGLARQEVVEELPEGTHSPTLAYSTEPGSVLGTVGYMSPEQVRGESVDHLSDVFSLGCVLYELLSGRRAFAAPSSADAMAAILKEEPPELTDVEPPVPPALERIVRHCLEKSKEERFQSARDLAFDLDSLSTASAASAALSAVGEAGRPAWRRAVPWVAGALAVAGALFLGRATSPRQELRLEQVSFGRGFVGAARFAPDGRSILYEAAWEGRPLRIFLKRPEGPEAAPLGPENARLLSVSPAGELAILLEPRLVYQLQSSPWVGTLARLPIDGTVPREAMRDVTGADWSSDGSELAIVRDVGARGRLELPPGNVLYETPGWLSAPRFSPDGSMIAVSEHSDRHVTFGRVVVVDRAGKSQVLTGRDAAPFSGLTWSADGQEIWYGSQASIRAVALSGGERVVLRLPGWPAIGDVSADGRVLLFDSDWRLSIEAIEADVSRTRDLTWLGWSIAMDLSADGRNLLFYEGLWAHEGVTAPSVLAMRGLDASPVQRLVEGFTGAFSPDGGWIATGQDRVVLHPLGPGEARELDGGTLEDVDAVAWLPRGDRVVFTGREPGEAPRLFVQDLEGGPPHPISPEQTHLGLFLAPSPDGRDVAAQGPGGRVYLYPLTRDGPRPLPGLGEGDIPIRWGPDRHSFYFYRAPQSRSYEVYRLDVPSGRRERIRELTPEDPAGVMANGGVLTTADARTFVFTYLRGLGTLYVVDGLR